MLGWFWGPKETQVLNAERNYINIEFLTEEEKVKKEVAIANLKKEYSEDDETIIPYEDSFPCSFRFTLDIKKVLGDTYKNATAKSGEENEKNTYKSDKYEGKYGEQSTEYDSNKPKTTSSEKLNMINESYSTCSMSVKKIMSTIMLSKGEEANFYLSYVENVKLIMQHNEQLCYDQMVELFDQREVELYNPDEVFEIIYEPKSLWERIKHKAKTTVKNFPAICASFFSKFLGYLLTLMGLNLNAGMTAMIWKVVPMKMILTWLATIISVFFPALAPLLGISKLIL